jgi:hypothetical protein
MVGHVLDEHAFFAALEDALQYVPVVVLRLRLHVGVAVAEALFAAVVSGRERFVQDLEIVSFHEDPLEGGRYGPGHRPQRNGFVLAH